MAARSTVPQATIPSTARFSMKPFRGRVATTLLTVFQAMTRYEGMKITILSTAGRGTTHWKAAQVPTRLDGGSGGEHVHGHSGDDTYIYTSGNNVYDFDGANTVILPSGITQGDVSFYRVDDDPQSVRSSLFMVVDELGSIEFEEMVESNGSMFSYFNPVVFADTSTLNLLDLTSLVTYGGFGNDAIVGAYGNYAIDDVRV